MTAAGHEVRVAAPPAFVPAVVGAGPDRRAAGLRRGHPRAGEGGAGLPGLPDFELESLRAGRGHLGGDPRAVRAERPVRLALYNDHLLDDLVALAREWRPDLVVRDPLAFAAGVAAHVVGARQIRCCGRWTCGAGPATRSTSCAPRTPGRAPRTRSGLAEASAARHGATSTRCSWTVTPRSTPCPRRCACPATCRRSRCGSSPTTAGPGPEWVRRAPAPPSDLPHPRHLERGGLRGRLRLGAHHPGRAGRPRRRGGRRARAGQQEIVRTAGPLPGNARLVDPIALHVLLPTCAAIVAPRRLRVVRHRARGRVPQLAISTSISDHERRGRGLERAGRGASCTTERRPRPTSGPRSRS